MPRCALILAMASLAWAGSVDPPAENHLFGARAQGTGGAALVGARGFDAAFVNPAGVLGAGSQVGGGVLSLDYGRRLGWAGAVVERGPWAYVLTWALASAGDLPLVDEEGLPQGTTSWQRHRVGLGLARSLDFLTRVGGGVWFLHTSSDETSSEGVGVDVGLTRGILPPLLAVGATVHDALSVVRFRGGAHGRERVAPRLSAGLKIGLAEGRIECEWNLYRRAGWRRWRALTGCHVVVTDGLCARIGFGGGGLSAGFGVSHKKMGLGFAMIPDELGSSGHGVEAIWTR